LLPLPDSFSSELAFVLGELHGTIAKLKQTPVPEIDTPDTLGMIGFAQRELAAIVKGLKAELPMDRTTTYEGGSYRIKPSNSATRTYNTPRLVADLAVHGEHPLSTLLRLVQEDVVRVSWQWKKLQDAMQMVSKPMDVNTDLAMDVATVSQDDPHVGEKWTTKPVVEGKKGDE